MKSIVIILISFVSVGAFAQAKQATPAASDCRKEWFSLFKQRGANPIADGTHEVIISLSLNDYSECFMGKIDVAGQKLSGKLLIQKDDGTYEEFDKRVSEAYQNKEGVLKEELREVINGMSSAVTLKDGETIRLFFFKSLADKPKANKKAPSPASLVKN